MVTGIVIPRDGGGGLRIQELATIGDFQEVAGGWLEPIEIESLGVTAWVNEGAHEQRGSFNSRATALWWYYSANAEARRFMLGDVVLIGNGRESDGADAPEQLIHGLFSPHEFVIQVSPRCDDVWYDTYARFDSIFAAATWCMVLGLSTHRGPDFRISPETPSSACDEYETPRAERLW